MKHLVRGAVLFSIMAAALAGGATDSVGNPARMVVVPFSDARFVPADAARPDGNELAVVWGDPASGPSSMLLRMRRGEIPLHHHTSDYHLVLLRGTMRHWSQGQKANETPELAPGSFWFQPGKQVHGDACLTDECLMFVNWAAARDSFLAAPVLPAGAAQHRHDHAEQEAGERPEPQYDGKPGSVTGHLRDAACLLRNPVAGAPDDAVALECARECVRGGSPLIVYTTEGALYLVLSPRIPDRAEPERWLPYVGKLVRASGRVFERAGVRAIAIEQVEVVVGTE